MKSLLAYWQLRERPFELVTDRRFYYQSSEHKEALARLRYLVEERTMYAGLLSGEIGCGKSITGRVLASSLDSAQFATIVFENAHFRFADHARHLASSLGLTAEAKRARTAGQVYELVRQALRQLCQQENRHTVLIFDEAQDLRPDTMADLKRLLNLNDDGVAQLSLILMGQPELREKIKAHPPLEQRISLRFHLGSMSPDDCSAYLKHRLQIAGHPTGEAFYPEAESLLAQESRGIPREINRLAKLSLEMARSDNSPRIEPAHIHAVVEDLRQHGAMSPSPILSE